MAQFMFSTRKLSKSKNHSTRKISDYDTRETKKDKSDLFGVGQVNMPKWATKPNVFWLAADKNERKNGMLARRVIMSLPYAIAPAEREALVRQWLETNCKNMPASYAIHDGQGEPKNPHVHILVSERIWDGVDRDAELFFRRYDAKNPTKSGAKKAVMSMTNRDWLVDARKSWAETLNRALPLDKQVSHLSNAARGLPPPTPKIGQRVIAAERKGIRTRLVSHVLGLPVGDNKIRCLSFVDEAGKTIDFRANLESGESVEMIGRVTKSKAIDMIAAIKAKGWTRVELTGSPEFRAEMRAQLKLHGIGEITNDIGQINDGMGIKNGKNRGDVSAESGRGSQRFNEQNGSQPGTKVGDFGKSKFAIKPANVSYPKVFGSEDATPKTSKFAERERSKTKNNFGRVPTGKFDAKNNNNTVNLLESARDCGIAKIAGGAKNPDENWKKNAPSILTLRVRGYHTYAARKNDGYDRAKADADIAKILLKTYTTEQVIDAIRDGSPSPRARDQDYLDNLAKKACPPAKTTTSTEDDYQYPAPRY